MKNVYIFDLDGTLVNSMPYWAHAMLAFLDKHNIKYPPDVIKIIVPLGMKGTVEYFRTLGLEISLEDFMEEVYSSLFVFYENDIELKEGVREYLVSLKESGASLNVLTASPKKFIIAAFSRLGVIDLFQNLWSCDDFSLGKTEPEIFHAALERLGATTMDAVFFDDNVGAVKGAKRAGLFTVAVADEASVESREELIQNADLFINSFKELSDKEPF